MSEQINPTSEDELTEPAAQPAVTMIPPAVDALPAIEDDEEDEVDEGGDSEESGGDDGRYVEGPATYIERERGGRSRRIGSDVKVDDIDYKNIPLLSRFLDRRGRILSRRKTRVSAKVQRNIVVAIKRARHLALLPYTADQTRLVRKRR
jgi:small subunit ribosomal protein S18